MQDLLKKHQRFHHPTGRITLLSDCVIAPRAGWWVVQKESWEHALRAPRPSVNNHNLGDGFKNVYIFFMFIPIWGRFPFWLIFFQMGWCNHQLVIIIVLVVVAVVVFDPLCRLNRKTKKISQPEIFSPEAERWMTDQGGEAFFYVKIWRPKMWRSTILWLYWIFFCLNFWEDCFPQCHLVQGNMALLSDNDGVLRPLKKAAFPNKNATTQRDNKVP